jgi:hypothetical protein
MAAKLAGLPDPWRHDLLTWARLLRDGGPRSRARDEQTVRAYLGVAANAAATWPQHGHLCEVVRDDVLPTSAHCEEHAGRSPPPRYARCSDGQNATS